jgi:hypothetical protein
MSDYVAVLPTFIWCEPTRVDELCETCWTPSVWESTALISAGAEPYGVGSTKQCEQCAENNAE